MRIVAFIAVAALALMFELHLPAEASRLKVIPLGAPKSARTATGSAVDGLALSLTTTPLKRETPGHLWASLEIRNVSSRAIFVKNVGLLSSFSLIVSNASGASIPTFRLPTMEYDPPAIAAGTPIAPGTSVFLPVPLDAYVAFPKSGVYTVRVVAVRLVDVERNETIPVSSNDLAVRVP